MKIILLFLNKLIKTMKSKKIITLTLLFCSLVFLTGFLNFNKIESKDNITFNTSDFCDGWEDGYCEGWKDVKGQLAICPITPICPMAPYDQNTYKGGYNMGFKAGMKKARKN